MIFNTDYVGPMDRDNFSQETADIESPLPTPVVYESSAPNQEKPLIKIKDIGQTVSEGPQLGSLLDQEVAAIRKGVRTIELQTTPEGAGARPGGGGSESYGTEQREEIRKLAELNNVNITSVHAPPQIGNLSGFTQNGFDDSVREQEVTEIKKAVDFAADVGGGAIVVHTGEYPRPIWDAKWNKKEGKWKNAFMQYEEEPQKAAKYLVDSKTGRIIKEVAKNINVYEPVYQKTQDGRYIDINGNPTEDPFKRVPIFVKPEDVGKEMDVGNGHKVKITKDMVNDFLVVPRGWEYFEKEANEWNKRHANNPKTPEEIFVQTRTEAQINDAKGWALYYKQNYDKLLKMREKYNKALDFYTDVYNKTPEEERWRLNLKEEYDAQHLIPPDIKSPVDYLKEKLKETDERIKQINESATAAEVRAKEAEETLQHVKTLDKYAEEKSALSYAELGVYAMRQSQSKKAKKPIYIAPEHIFPHMGYGSHPEELIELVQNARKKMTTLLTSKKIPDPSGKTDMYGKPVYIDNPYYKPGVNADEAKKLAEKHIKATLDTQHIGMWYRYFTPKPGETEEQRRKRFQGWYMDMIKKMEKAKIIGNIHLVDGFGYGHTHMPAGQGMFPVKDAIEYLKKKGYSGPINSEGYGEGSSRIISKPWELFGANIYGVSVPRTRQWTDVSQSYFNKLESPYFIFGAYAPSNDWTLWSQVPFE